jgi:HEAT repeat protein
VEAVTAMGELASDSSVVNELRNVYNHPNVLVKTAGVNALKKLYERAVITDKMIIIRELNNIFIPGTYAHNNSP